MRETLDKILQKLAVNHVLSPYETQPWFHDDEEKETTCSAEIRMGGSGQDLEAEIQLLKEEEEEDEEKEGETSSGGRQQILWMRIEPVAEGKWEPKKLIVKGKNYTNEFHDWEGKGCQFFRSCVESIQMGEMPDFESLTNKIMVDDSDKGGGRKGRIGRKSPKANPAALMGMKK